MVGVRMHFGNFKIKVKSFIIQTIHQFPESTAIVWRTLHLQVPVQAGRVIVEY